VLLEEVEDLFPEMSIENYQPHYARWLIPRMESLQIDQTLQIVRELDKKLNNTSVILLFEVGKHKLLFPGDAQIENWSYCLKHAPDHEIAENRKLLAGVTLYKVGHHGSLNATPKSLWNLFEHRSEEDRNDRLRTVLSTMPGTHGDVERGTEVPRGKLVNELHKWSDLVTTEDLTDTLCEKIELTV
jgi:hypothetical protein